MALPEPGARRHWSLRLATSLGALLFAATISAVLLRIVLLEYWFDPATGWLIWANGTAFVFFGTLILLDREQRANGVLLVVFGILGQLPFPELLPTLPARLGFVPVWAIFFIALNSSLPSIVLAVVLLRFPERRLQKSYERWFIAVMASLLLGSEAVHAVTWPCWATPARVTPWPWWLANCDISEAADFAAQWGQMVGAAGLILLLAMRILRTRGLDRRVYIPVHIASIAGMGIAAYFIAETVRGLEGPGWVRILQGLLIVQGIIPIMLFLANLGRRLLQLRIAGMVAEINVARTPDGIQAALRRALDDPSLEIYLWSAEHEQYVDTAGRFVGGESVPDRVAVEIANPDGTPRARISADESVTHHRELLRAASEAGGMALQNSVLQASLLATIERERSSRELSETLSRLLPTGLADRLRGEGLRLGQSEMVEVTLLMSDVRGYSGIAETTDPAQLAVQVNEHRRAMNRVIMSHGGIVMQYVGDAVFAVFGPTTSPGQHAYQAFAAAKEMHGQQHEINEKWRTLGLPIFGMGIGLSTGRVAAALLGSDERFEYTLVGDVVNLAQRLQDLARPAGTTVMSQATWDSLTELPDEYEELKLQLVKGRQTPITCYRIMVVTDDLPLSGKRTDTPDTLSAS